MKNKRKMPPAPNAIKKRIWITLFSIIVLGSIALFGTQKLLFHYRSRFNAPIQEVSQGLEQRYLVYTDHSGTNNTSSRIMTMDGSIIKTAQSIQTFIPSDQEIFFQIWRDENTFELEKLVDGNLVAFPLPGSQHDKNIYPSSIVHMSYSPDSRFLLFQGIERWDLYDEQSRKWIEHVETTVATDPLVKDQPNAQVLSDSEVEWQQNKPHELFMATKKYAQPSGSPYHILRYTFNPESFEYNEYPIDASYGPLKVNNYLGNSWLEKNSWHWCSYNYANCHEDDNLGPDIKVKMSFAKKAIIRKSDKKSILKWSSYDFVKVMPIPGSQKVLVQMNNELGLLDTETEKFAKLFDVAFIGPDEMTLFEVQVL